MKKETDKLAERYGATTNGSCGNPKMGDGAFKAEEFPTNDNHLSHVVDDIPLSEAIPNLGDQQAVEQEVQTASQCYQNETSDSNRPGAQHVRGFTVIRPTSLTDDTIGMTGSTESESLRVHVIARAELVDDPVEATEIDLEQTKEMQVLRNEYSEVNKRLRNLQRKTARRQVCIIFGIILLALIGTGALVMIVISASMETEPFFSLPMSTSSPIPPTASPIAYPKESTGSPVWWGDGDRNDWQGPSVVIPVTPMETAPTTMTPSPSPVPTFSPATEKDKVPITAIIVCSLAFFLAIVLCMLLSRSRRQAKSLLPKIGPNLK